MPEPRRWQRTSVVRHRRGVRLSRWCRSRGDPDYPLRSSRRHASNRVNRICLWRRTRGHRFADSRQHRPFHRSPWRRPAVPNHHQTGAARGPCAEGSRHSRRRHQACAAGALVRRSAQRRRAPRGARHPRAAQHAGQGRRGRHDRAAVQEQGRRNDHLPVRSDANSTATTTPTSSDTPTASRRATRSRRGRSSATWAPPAMPPKTRPHLHFAVFKLTAGKHWWEGTPIDPYDILR